MPQPFPISLLPRQLHRSHCPQDCCTRWMWPPVGTEGPVPAQHSHRTGSIPGSRALQRCPKTKPWGGSSLHAQIVPSLTVAGAAGCITQRLAACCPGGLGKPLLTHASCSRLPAHFHLFLISLLIQPHNDSLLMDAAVFITCLN